jgi:uncharacterized protein (TIGR02145 family)
VPEDPTVEPTDAPDDLAHDPDAPTDPGEDESTCIVPDVPEDPQEDTEADAVTDAPSDAGDGESPDVPGDTAADASSEDAGGDDAGGDDAGEAFTCGDTLVDPRDDRSYPTVLIGAQCWMARNLDVGVMVAGTANQLDNGVIEKYCYADLPANCATYGGLYQWDEMMGYAPSDPANPSTTRGICPPGWHVPSDAEWQELEMHLGMTAEEASMVNTWRGEGVGTALKPGGASGYDALMSGRRDNGPFNLITLYEYMYSSTEHLSSYAWRRCLGAADDDVGRWNTFPKTWGLSVRCVLD